MATPRTSNDSGMPSKTILLVDDDPAILALFSVRLEQAGFQVLKAHSANEALQRAEQGGRIDVLATDLILTDQFRLAKRQAINTSQHGLVLMRQLVSRHPGLKVVLFSGQTDDIIKSVGPIPVAIAFLRKPFGPEALVHTVQQVLQAPSPEVPARRASEPLPLVTRCKTAGKRRVSTTNLLVVGSMVLLGVILFLMAYPRWQGYLQRLW
jgi:CheY-like chemotaxis protein